MPRPIIDVHKRHKATPSSIFFPHKAYAATRKTSTLRWPSTVSKLSSWQSTAASDQKQSWAPIFSEKGTRIDIVYRNGSPTPDTSTQKEARTPLAPGPVWLGRARTRDTWHRKYATAPSPVFPRSFMILLCFTKGR